MGSEKAYLLTALFALLVGASLISANAYHSEYGGTDNQTDNESNADWSNLSGPMEGDIEKLYDLYHWYLNRIESINLTLISIEDEMQDALENGQIEKYHHLKEQHDHLLRTMKEYERIAEEILAYIHSLEGGDGNETEGEEVCKRPTCDELGHECGIWEDGCGNILECGNCSKHSHCINGICIEDCVPKDCESAGYECGKHHDGCGGSIECGFCEDGYNCTGGKCIEETCIPDCSCASSLCVLQNCSNGCGGVCEGAIQPNCTGIECGTSLNDCGRCGECMDGKECINGTCHEPVIPVCVGELCDVEENESGEYEDKELLERYEEYRNETDNYKKINLSRENRFMLKNNEWKKYRSVEKLRSSMIQEYETDAGVQVNLSETKADITVEKVDAKKAVMINISREPEAILGEAEVAAAREVMAVTTLDIGVVNDVEDIQLEVERLEAKPEHVTEAPAGGVYQYIEIEKREIVDEDIEDVGIDFRVDKSWLSEKNITNNSQVALYRLEDGDWKEVSTIWIGEDDLYSYYQSFSPGLSYFVIGITGAASSPIELELPGERGDALAGTGADEIARIKFNWEFVLIVIVVVVILVLLKYTPIPGKMAGIFNRESVQDLQKKLTDFKGEREEALNRYYKREITKEQMEEIVNDIKKKEFDVEMRIKRMQEKKSQNTQS